MVNPAPMTADRTPPASASLRDEVKTAVIWRSGSQIAAQLVAWCSTLAVIRILDPADYGVFAMTQVVLAFLSFLNGYGFASALVQDREIDERKIRQAFGMMLLVNAGIALIQLGLAPLAADYYRQPIVADMLRLQALIFLATPFIALPEALLIRELDFRRPALVTMIATVVSASVALGCALADMDHHRPAGEVRERLAREARRGIARRNDDVELQAGAFSRLLLRAEACAPPLPA